LQRFYVGRPLSGLVWLFTGGLFGVGWVIDFFLIPEFVEEHNKKVFHQQMVETGSSLLYDGEYGQGGGGGGGAAYYPTPGYAPQGGAFAGAVAPYSQHVYYPQGGGGGGGGRGGGGYEAYYS
jgi:hypothetical protein